MTLWSCGAKKAKNKNIIYQFRRRNVPEDVNFIKTTARTSDVVKKALYLKQHIANGLTAGNGECLLL